MKRKIRFTKDQWVEFGRDAKLAHDILHRLRAHALAAKIPRPHRPASHGLRAWPFRREKELWRLDKAVLQAQAARLALEHFAAEQHPDWRDVIKYF